MKKDYQPSLCLIISVDGLENTTRINPDFMLGIQDRQRELYLVYIKF